MRKTVITVLFLVLATIFASDKAQKTEQWFKENPHSMPHWMTPEEEARIDEIGQDFVPTEAPVGPVRNIAEYEKMESVLIRYPFGIPYDLIAEMSQDCKVTTLVSSQSSQNYVLGQYQSNGVNVDNCEFIIANTDSYWTRDYGPWFIIDGNNELGISDHIYNRPRPNDNAVPSAVGEEWDINVFSFPIITAGGNYMCDGTTIAASSDLIYPENPSLTQAQVHQNFEDYLGIETYHVVDDPNNTYIDHIDCWGKFLAPDKILIREVPTSHPQYDEIEATADYFAEQTCAYGYQYEVYRVYTSNDEPYTNSLILNNKVFIPITGSSNDDDAIATYEEAMPGYEVFGFYGSWESTDALHCRTKGLADRNMLYIDHMPKYGELPVDIDVEISCSLLALSGSEISEIKLYYSIDNGTTFTDIEMELSDDLYTATIPDQPNGTQVKYYIYAKDADNNTNMHPFIGEADAHDFVFGEVSIGEEEQVANTVELLNNYPNPFNPETTIAFKLSKNASVNLVIYDSFGKVVKEMGEKSYNKGTHKVNFNAQNLSAGIYYCKILSNDMTITRKMVFVK